jgi:hypothetical protein
MTPNTDKIDQIAKAALKGHSVPLPELQNVWAVTKEAMSRGYSDDAVKACTEAYVVMVARK